MLQADQRIVIYLFILVIALVIVILPTSIALDSCLMALFIPGLALWMEWGELHKVGE